MPPFLLSIAERYLRPAFFTAVNFMSWAPRLALSRLIAKWRSLLTIVVGVVLGAGIGALVPLYTTAVAQVGLVQRLDEEPAHDSNARLRIALRPFDFASMDDVLAAATLIEEDYIQATVDEYLATETLEGWVTSNDVSPYLETDKMGVMEDEETPLRSLNANDNSRASLIYLQDWQDEVRVVEGQLPAEAAVPDGVDFNVAISTTVANTFGLQTGDVLIVDQRRSRNGSLNSGAWETSQPFTVHITAIIAPGDEESAFWMALRGEDDTPLNVIRGSWPAEFRMLADRDTVISVMQDFVPQTPLTFGWRFLFNHEELPYSRITEARTALRDFEAVLFGDLGQDNPELASQVGLAEGRADLQLQYDYDTRLVDFSQTREDVDEGILLDYDEKQETNAVPFTLLLLEVGALVLFFLIVTAALVRRGERREIAMLQSRGAFDSHILALRGIEALLICLFGAIAAPFIAQQLLILLGPSVAGTDEFPLPLTSDVFLFSTLAALVTFVALTLTLIPVLRLPLISAGGAAIRSGRMAWWQRYYVDVVLALVGLGALYQLIATDTPLLEGSGDAQRIDPLLVLAPALLFLGLGSIALRLFPFVAAGASSVASRGRGILGSLATWQLSREPIHYGRLTFLLALAIGIGWFATSFRATVNRSQTDQARYQVGTDIRMVERDARLNVDRVRESEYYTAFDEVAAASPTYDARITQVSRSSTSEYRSGELLAIDSRNFGDVALDYWRSDLGSIRVPYNPDLELNMPVVGEALPGETERIGLWARLDLAGFSFNFQDQNYQVNLGRLLQRVNLGLRLQDEAGTWLLVPLEQQRVEYLRTGNLDSPGLGSAAHVSSGWVYYEADISALNYQPVGEMRLVSINWEHRSTSTNGEQNIRLALAEMSLIDSGGIATPFPILNDGDWDFVYDGGALATGEIRAGLALDDLRTDVIYVVFSQEALRTRVGINLNYPAPAPMEAIVSETFAEANGFDLAAGEPERFQLVNIAGTNVTISPRTAIEYFPSLYNEERPFVIVDVRELMYWLNQRPSAQYYPDEIWVKLAEENTAVDEVTAVMDDLTGGVQSDTIRVREETYAEVFDELETDPLTLGLLGLMFLAFLIGLTLSIVGLLTYAALTAQARRSEFGVLRALGLPSSRVVGSLIFEQIFVVVIAGILGSILGYILSTSVVPTLALGATGEGVVPPFITEIEWPAIGRFWLVMLAVLSFVFAFSFLVVRQLSLSRTLRLGEE